LVSGRNKIMTNLIVGYVTLVTVTNWTGITLSNREIGYITTNVNAVVAYKQRCYDVGIIEKLPSNIAVWREHSLKLFITNWSNSQILIPYHNRIYTNYISVTN